MNPYREQQTMTMSAEKEAPPFGFSENLFWDVDPRTLDMERHAKYIVGRVLERGTLQDWQLLCRCFTLPGVIEIARTLRSLDPKALAFLCVAGNVPREFFRCCTSKQLTPKHWIC